MTVINMKKNGGNRIKRCKKNWETIQMIISMNITNFQKRWTNIGIKCKKRQKKKKKERVSRNTELTILKQKAMIHGENWEFKGQVLYRMIQRLKSLTPTSAKLTSNTLIYE